MHGPPSGSRGTRLRSGGRLTTTHESADPTRLVVVLTAAIAAISASAVIVAGIDGVHPLAIAWWRCTGSALLLAPALRGFQRRHTLRTVLAGVALAAHFSTWFASLQLTTVLHSTVLVCLSPAWVGLATWWTGEHRPRLGFWAGLVLAVTGAAWMATDRGGAVTLEGDLFALVAGMLSAAYLLLGRPVRNAVGLGPYMAGVTLAAALALTPLVAVGRHALTGFTPTTWALLAACVAGPQLVGHSGLNWAMRHLPATTVSSLILLEPVGATLLAIPFLGEWPAPASLLGGAVVVGGVVVSIQASRRPARPVTTESRPPPS